MPSVSIAGIGPYIVSTTHSSTRRQRYRVRDADVGDLDVDGFDDILLMRSDGRWHQA